MDQVLTTAVSSVIGGLEPVLDPLLAALLSITLNKQIVDEETGSFTVNALCVDVLPGSDSLVSLPLASSTVRVVPEPAVLTSLDPTSGPETGGTDVIINGEGFTGATGVTFGDEAGVDFEVVSDTEIRVATPPHDPGTVDVVVDGPGGPSNPLEFTYLAVPAISSIVPDEGQETGGTDVTITGSGFDGATSVTFDGIPGTDFTVVNDNTITVTTPRGTSGEADVIVIHPVEDSEPYLFTYLEIPRITEALDPTSGPDIGGTELTITGTGFTGTTGVTFGDEPGTDFTVVSDTEIRVFTPPHVPGTVDVVIIDPAGNSDPLEFTYTNAASSITSLNPSYGPETGGTVVRIIGTGFGGATGVTFDGLPGTDFEVVSITEIRVTTPAHAPGVVEAVVLDPAGDSEPMPFRYDPAPSVVESLSPTSGPEIGGTVVTIIGEGFDGATGVNFGDEPGVDFQVIDDNTIVVTTPPHAPGTVDVIVIDPNGNSNPLRFRYEGPTRPGMPSTGAEGTSVLLGVGLLAAAAAAGAMGRRRRA